MTRPLHSLPEHLQQNSTPLSVLLIGAGGNGSELYDGLVRLHQAMIALGGTGLAVTVIDDDEVSPSNIVRQRFWPHEIGTNKAVALVQRTNCMIGTNWSALPIRYTGQNLGSVDLVITAVDNREVRKQVVATASTHSRTLWLDLGCEGDCGQVVLGRLADRQLDDPWPNAVAHFPDLMSGQDNNRPSCSAADSLSRQDLMINATVAGAAVNLLWKTLRTGTAPYNGVMIDLSEGRQQAIPFMPAQAA
jgi:PRTRC genetic system ThiF family protein